MNYNLTYLHEIVHIHVSVIFSIAILIVTFALLLVAKNTICMTDFLKLAGIKINASQEDAKSNLKSDTRTLALASGLSGFLSGCHF